MSSSTEAVKESYGWWTSTSRSRMTANRLRSSSAASISRAWVTGVHGSSFSSGRSRPCSAHRLVRSSGARWNEMSSSVTSSSVTRSSITLSDAPASISKRTARPKRRRRSSISRAASRSSASSSSTVRSALRVTRNIQWSTTVMPGNSASRWAAIRSSSRTKRSPSGSPTKRGSVGGTLTRAKRSWACWASYIHTARLSDRLEMYGKGWAGSTPSGVSTGKTRSSNTSSRCLRSSRSSSDHLHSWIPCAAMAGASTSTNRSS